MFFMAPGQKKGGGGGDFTSRSKSLTFLFTIFKRKANLFIYLPLEMAPLSQTFSRNAPSFFLFVGSLSFSVHQLEKSLLFYQPPSWA